MATNYFNLPTVDPDSTLSFPDAVNGLAIATDDVLQSVQDSFGSIDVGDLPVASTKELGVVRVGDGFRVFADGSLSTTAAPFKLHPATDKALGGVFIGTNVEVVDEGSENDGSISIGFGAFNTTRVSSTELANGGVGTADFKNLAVDATKIGGSVMNDISKAENLFATTEGYQFDRSGSSGGTYARIICNKISDSLWFFMRPFSDAKIMWGQDVTGAKLGLDRKHGDVSGSIPNMLPGELFHSDVILHAYGYNYEGGKWVVCNIYTIVMHGATATMDLRHTQISSATPTRFYMPPTIVNMSE